MHASNTVGNRRGVGKEIEWDRLGGLAQGSKEEASSPSMGVHLVCGGCIIGIEGCHPCLLVWDGLPQKLPDRNEMRAHFRGEVAAR